MTKQGNILVFRFLGLFVYICDKHSVDRIYTVYSSTWTMLAMGATFKFLTISGCEQRMFFFMYWPICVNEYITQFLKIHAFKLCNSDVIICQNFWYHQISHITGISKNGKVLYKIMNILKYIRKSTYPYRCISPAHL